jgi:uncharacterized membrane protein YeiH
VIVCAGVSTLAFFTAHLVQSRLRLILWLDAAGLALFAATGAERAIGAGAPPIVAIVMGIITACFGGIIRDTLSQDRSVIFSYEIYVAAALASATTFVALNSLGLAREIEVTAAFIAGLVLRGGGAIQYGWSLPRYRPYLPRSK